MARQKHAFQIIRGGLALDPVKRTAVSADILVEGDSIREIGAPGMAAPADAAVVDATDKLVMPGFVNAHTHGQGSLGKGLGDKWSLELLLNAAPWATSGLTLEDKYTAALLNAAEMVLKGCTSAYDMFFEFPTPSVEGLGEIGRAYAEVGVRVVLAPMMADLTLYQAIPGLMEAIPEPHRKHVQAMRAAPQEEHLQVCGEAFRSWAFDRDVVRPALGPTIPLHCTDDFIRACRDLAEEYDVGIQMHLGESKVQAVSGIKRYGRTLTAHIDELGLLGPRFTGAHCIWLDDDDLKRMADRGAAIAHNPGSNLRLGSGVAPVRRMMDAGVQVGIGTDGSASSDNQNMFEAVRTATFVSSLLTPRPEEWLDAWETLELATAGSARALGMEKLVGHLAPGYKADLLFLDLDNINFVPFNNAAGQIVNCEDGSAVDSVMIGGRMVLAGRKFTELDYAALRRRVTDCVARLRERTAEPKERMMAMASYVSHHCVGLVCEHYHVNRRID